MLTMVLPRELSGQYYFRVKCDISIKEKNVDGSLKLILGTVYYDINHKKIVYDISFPEKELWVLQDTSYFLFKKNQLVERSVSIIYPEFSVFHLVLQGGLKDYGLSEHPVIKLKEIDKQKDGIVRIYGPTSGYEDKLGKIKMLTKNRRLEAVLFYNVAGRLMSRQFFEEYKLIKGLEFPTRIVQFAYPNPELYTTLKNDEHTLIQTTFSNVQINRTDEEYMYNYPVPNLN
jgi:hypothetical protein